MIGFGLLDAANYVPVPLDPRYATISLLKVHSENNNDGRHISFESVPVIRASDSNDEKLIEVVANLGRDARLDDFYTIGDEASLELKGSVSGESVDYIILNLIPCNTVSSSGCAKDDEI